MNLRLFPLLLFAITSLLTLKAFDMVFSGEALFHGTASAQAEDKPAVPAAAAKPEEKPSAEKPAAAEDEPKRRSLLDAVPVERPKEKISLPPGEGSAETLLNERLGEKRRSLEERDKELDLRESLLKMAEKKLEGRLGELKQTEAKLEEANKTKEEQSGLKIKNLVLMYETMKPKEAAAIFDKLDMAILIEVASRMNPRVTALVMAKMSPDAAQKLTAEMTRRSLAPPQEAMPGANKPQTPENPKELQRIDKAPAKQS